MEAYRDFEIKVVNFGFFATVLNFIKFGNKLSVQSGVRVKDLQG